MKKVAPIVIIVLICSQLLLYFCILMIVRFFMQSVLLTILFSIIGIGILAIVIALIYTLIIRLKEIDKEDEDDISKY